MSIAELQQRLTELNEEQSQLRRQISDCHASIDASHQSIKGAQQRYDLQGDDAAKAEIASHRAKIAALEEQCKRAMELSNEYPARVEGVQNELGHARYREDLRRMADERLQLVAEFDVYCKNLLTVIDDLHLWTQHYYDVRSLGQRLENFARANSLPLPEIVPSVITEPEAKFWRRGFGRQVEMTLDETRRKLAGK